ncbi:carboxymuconolactone decarboxylase family protein [Paremcibacter congregatus]|uniref:Carboxymuconolactone decarboxylase n=1 Tax=Paremcibacter congregatus TaxID=2043170 RepID=A0A2G4YNH8_9PROT|nr:carboxymuconolactone decarboxylase family protein [Paremcibacter congregatus]PHZ83872.1 carboxymuconolactone decarboxylase [Paremcibacter congregatus]QDE27577.1 carboxymuconolactone decarboxylase family protein [Paremcibacter congregatus]
MNIDTIFVLIFEIIDDMVFVSDRFVYFESQAMIQHTKKNRLCHLNPPYTQEISSALQFIKPKNNDIDTLKLFRTFVKNLPLTTVMGELGKFFLSAGQNEGASFDLRSREIVIVRVTARCHCEYEWGVHIAMFTKKAKLTTDQTYSLVHGDSGDTCWSSLDAALINMVDDFHDTGTLRDETFTLLSNHFTETQLMEFFILAGWYHAISYFANGAKTELEDWATRFPKKVK